MRIEQTCSLLTHEIWFMAYKQACHLHQPGDRGSRQMVNSALAAVPQEILCHILSYLDPPALKAARLTNRKLSEDCIRYLYRNLSVVVSFDRFSGARNVAATPWLSGAVRSIVFFTGIVPGLLPTTEAYRISWNGHSASGGAVAVEDDYRMFAEGLKEQQRLLPCKNDAQIFADIIPFLKGVRHISIAMDERSVFGYVNNRYSVMPLWSSTLPSTHKALKALLDQLGRKGNSPVRELRLDVSEITIEHAFDTASFNVLHDRTHWTHSITYLDLCIVPHCVRSPSIPSELRPQVGSADDLFHDCYWTSFSSKIGHFIASMPNLRGLGVIFTDRHSRLDDRWHRRLDQPDEPPNYRACLSDVLKPGFHWRRLERLCLGNVVCERQDLWDVLLRHKSTLRRVGLYSMCLYAMSWCDLVRNMKSHLKLERASVAGRGVGRRPSGGLEGWGFVDGHDTPWPTGPHADEIRDVLKDKPIDETKKVSVREFLGGDGKWELDHERCIELGGSAWEIDSWDVLTG